MKIIRELFRFSEFGSSDVLKLASEQLLPPGPGELQIRQMAIGVNYIDIYHRKGVFAAPLPLPSGLGVEGVGEVIGIGDGVTQFSLGQKVGYVGGPPGGYATHRNIPAARVVAVPDSLDPEIVAGTLFKGLTAEYLIRRCVPIAESDTVLFHAAAGGVGSLAVQWLRHLGATVIGTAGSADKVAVAKRNGCDHVINYSEEDFVSRVRDLTAGRGVDVVYDSVGAETFMKSLDCLRPRGTMISFGESSGPVPPLNVGVLGAKGSLYLTRPSIAHYTAQRADLENAASDLFRAWQSGVINPAKPAIYRLVDAAKAHADLEARKTTGAVVLVP